MDICAYGGRRTVTQFGYQCNTTVNALPTDRTYTGQEQDTTGLMYYHARFFDPALGTFVSPDTMVPEPGRAIDYNRFAYTRNNPLKFSDPSGHRPDDGCETEGCTLPNGLEPDATWLLANGAYANVDPQITAAEDYNLVTEVLLPGAVMLVGGVAAGIIVEEAVLYGGTAVATTVSQAPYVLSNLRAEYEEKVRAILIEADRRLKAGESLESVARWAHSTRRQLGISFKEMTPQPIRQIVYLRNRLRYGDSLGPTIQYLRERGKSWEEIIQSAASPGGEDLLTPLLRKLSGPQ